MDNTNDVKITGPAVNVAPEARAREGMFHDGKDLGVSLHHHARGLKVTIPDQRVDGRPTVLLSVEQATALCDALNEWIDQNDHSNEARRSRSPR